MLLKELSTHSGTMSNVKAEHQPDQGCCLCNRQRLLMCLATHLLFDPVSTCLSRDKNRGQKSQRKARVSTAWLSSKALVRVRCNIPAFQVGGPSCQACCLLCTQLQKEAQGGLSQDSNASHPHHHLQQVAPLLLYAFAVMLGQVCVV